jgi:hypothetical protein
MNPKAAPRLALLLFAALAFIVPDRALAGDSAASVAAGGLVPRHSAHIVLARETIHISDKTVVVDYDFRNDSGARITTEVSFPVPPYKNGWDAMDPAIQSFRALRIWVDGNPVNYLTEAKAYLNDRDISKTLQADRIDIPSFGHLEIGRDQHSAKYRIAVPDFLLLPERERHRLQHEGIFSGGEGYSLYAVHLQYHWTQTFPAHSTVHIRQEYAPVVGFMQIQPRSGAFQAAPLSVSRQTGGKNLSPSPAEAASLLDSFCTDTSLFDGMSRAKIESVNSENAIDPRWVDFTLTSANAWQKPIEDFTLIVERPQPKEGRQTLISFCSPGKVEKPDADHLKIHLTKFVPEAELHIGFFDLPKETPALSSAMR